MRFYLAFFIIFSFLFPFENMAVLPTVSKGKDIEAAREFRNHLMQFIRDNEQFNLVPGEKLKESFSHFEIPKLLSDDDILFRMGLVAGAAKICYTEIQVRGESRKLYIKIYDCQMKKKFLVDDFDYIPQLYTLAETIYKKIKGNYWGRSEYIDLVRDLQLTPDDIENIEGSGGTIEGQRLLNKYEISTDQYVTVALLGGSARELSYILDSKRTIAYYLKYLSYVYGTPVIR